MKTKVITTFLSITGIIGIYIGASLLFTPITFEGSANIPVANNANLLSEIRSSGGTLLAAGIIMLWGAFNDKLTKISLIVCCLFYSAYGISRVIAMLFDGLPGSSLITVTIAELVIGFIGLVLLRNVVRSETM